MLTKERAVLVVVDVQDKIFPKDDGVVEKTLDQTVKLIQVANALKVPVLVTEQYPERLGATNEKVSAFLDDVDCIPKMEFSCMANDAFLGELESLRRTQLLIVGQETQICVLQTALGAMEAGYQAFVVRDAVMSQQKQEYKAGLHRMESAGAQIVTTQMAIFELLGEAGTPEFKALLPLLK